MRISVDQDGVLPTLLLAGERARARASGRRSADWTNGSDLTVTGTSVGVSNRCNRLYSFTSHRLFHCRFIYALLLCYHSNTLAIVCAVSPRQCSNIEPAAQQPDQRTAPRLTRRISSPLIYSPPLNCSPNSLTSTNVAQAGQFVADPSAASLSQWARV